MNTKLRKLVKLTATGLFLIALAINVKVTLDDPFVNLSEAAIAMGSAIDPGTGTGTTVSKYFLFKGDCSKEVTCYTSSGSTTIRKNGKEESCVLVIYGDGGSTSCTEVYCDAEVPVCP